jgi:hypothetical protein
MRRSRRNAASALAAFLLPAANGYPRKSSCDKRDEACSHGCRQADPVPEVAMHDYGRHSSKPAQDAATHPRVRHKPAGPGAVCGIADPPVYRYFRGSGSGKRMRPAMGAAGEVLRVAGELNCFCVTGRLSGSGSDARNSDM